MIQLLIDKNIEKIAYKYKCVFISESKIFIEKNLSDLKINLDSKESDYQIKIDYIDLILKDFEDIILFKPSEMKNHFSTFLLPSDKGFFKKIVDCLLYKKVREKYFIQAIKELQINCCAYCHIQSTNIVNEYYKKNHKGHKIGELKSSKAFFELDHYYSKSKYPFLCVSFYNLIPICSSCNKSKSNQNIEFDFYIESKSLIQDFKFNLSKGCVAKYKATQNKEDITIEITHPNNKILKAFDNRFSISKKYNEHKDIVEELIYKETKFNEIYLNSISNIFKIPFDKSIVNRIILGNYSEKEESLKRPLAKFYQDIAEDIKLIKRLK